MSDVIVLACIAVAVIILVLVGLAAICWLIQRLADEEECECSDYDPTFKPKFRGQKDTPK